MIIVAVIAVLNSVVSLYYYIRVLKHMFISESEGELPELKVTAPQMVFVLILLVPTLLFGIYFTPLVSFAENCLSILIK